MANEKQVHSRPRGRPSKSDDERETMRKHIAETAQRLFQTEGYATVSMRRLAKEADCSPMTLYKYYDGKIAVLQTLWAVVFKDLFDELRRKLRHEADAKERLRIACQFYVGYWLEHKEHYHMVFMAEGVTQPEVSMFIDNPEIGAGFGFLAQTIADASDKTADGAATKVMIDLIMAALHGIAHTNITISGYPWSNSVHLIDHLIDNLV